MVDAWVRIEEVAVDLVSDLEWCSEQWWKSDFLGQQVRRHGFRLSTCNRLIVESEVLHRADDFW